MLFSEFAQILSNLESTSGRTDMTVLLAETFKKLSNDEIKNATYMLLGRLAPLFIPLEFNFSRKLILRSLQSLVETESVLAIDIIDNEVESAYAKFGDSGLTAEYLLDKLNTQDTNLTINQIFSALNNLATQEGKGSQEGKMNAYVDLLRRVDPKSARYITRIIEGNIRLGLSDKTILDALSWFVAGDKSLRAKFDLAYGYRADIGYIAQIAKNSNPENIVENLSHIKLTPNTPLASKLVERESTPENVWERMQGCWVQPKLDGLRGQLHMSTKNHEREVNIFSRNMENMTNQFPELCAALKDLEVESIILDSEIIGFNDETQSFKTYQETMKRKRKYDIDEHASSIPVSAMCFDILFLNGEDLTQKPIEERINLLNKLLGESKSPLKMLETKKMLSLEDLASYYNDKVENGLEGIIIKGSSSVYEPGTRNFKWIKLKANVRSDLVDTIDVAILGYYIGRGDRSRFGFGALLVGVYSEKDDIYYSIGKVGSGFSEEQMIEMKQKMDEYSCGKEMPQNYVVDKSLYPDVWLRPGIVSEIIADEITRSPVHTAAIGIKTKVPNDNFEKGLSIRFPRMKIWLRDKALPNTVEEIIRMFELRKE